MINNDVTLANVVLVKELEKEQVFSVNCNFPLCLIKLKLAMSKHQSLVACYEHCSFMDGKIVKLHLQSLVFPGLPVEVHTWNN
jgi:hypothetical protein